VGPRRSLFAVRTPPGLAAAHGLDLVLDASVREVGATTLGSTALESSEEATESLAEAGFIGEGEGHSELLSERSLHVERMLPHLGVVVEEYGERHFEECRDRKGQSICLDTHESVLKTWVIEVSPSGNLTNKLPFAVHIRSYT
jgi:hypothetical protein